MYTKKMIEFFLLVSFLFFSIFSFSFAENIDATKKWAWSDNFGWVNFNPSNGNVGVFDDKLDGNFLVEGIGWVNLNPADGGVLNNSGILSGSAWGENIGWVDFSSVTIDPGTGYFAGLAITEDSGSINFTGDDVSVRTSWRGSPPEIDESNDKRFRGYAWSDNIGWISMNCSNTNSCGMVEYGVDVDNTGGVFGLAWSDHVGWLDFSYYNNAHLDVDTGNLTGDAQFLSALAEDDGWTGKVSLSGSSPQYGAVLDLDSYEFDDFAWGSGVVGWIDFKTTHSVVTLDPFKFLFTANKGLSYGDAVQYGGSLVLSWRTYGASSCTASGGGTTNWSTVPNKAAGEPSVATHTITGIQSDTVFVLTCQDSSGKTMERELNILVKPASPVVTLTAADKNINYNTAANLHWVAENVSSCVASGDWSGSKTVGVGSGSTGNLINPVNVFYLECLSDSPADYPDPVSDSIQVNVEKLTLDFYPEQNPIPYGDKIKLYWDVEFANSCVASGDLTEFNGSVVHTDGEHDFEAASPQTGEGSAYTVVLKCYGPRSQEETRTIQFRVGKNPVYREN